MRLEDLGMYPNVAGVGSPHGGIELAQAFCRLGALHSVADGDQTPFKTLAWEGRAMGAQIGYDRELVADGETGHYDQGGLE